jgi:hypothetical protein
VSDVTQILSAIEAGDPRAAEDLLPLVYGELRKLAAARMAAEKPGQTLQATALVHEAYMRLVGHLAPGESPGANFANRAHFFAAEAEAMRRGYVALSSPGWLWAVHRIPRISERKMGLVAYCPVCGARSLELENGGSHCEHCMPKRRSALQTPIVPHLSLPGGSRRMTLGQLGAIKREFKPGLENLVAGIMIGLLLIAAGGAALYFSTKGVIEGGGNLPFWSEKGLSWGTAGIVTAFGIGLVTGGVFLIRWIHSRFSFRLRVGQNGFAVSEKKSEQVFGWDDIVSVRETHLHERPPILKGVAKYVLPKSISKSFIVMVKQGDGFGFDGNIKGHLELARMIKEETERRRIPWETVDEQGY